MLPDSLRFVWGNPPVPGARWKLGVFNLTRPPRANRDLRRRLAANEEPEDAGGVLRISLRGLTVWGAGLACAAYLAGAAFIAQQLDARSPHNRIGYLDLVLPTRWDGIDRLRGEALLAEAKDELAAGRVNSGLTLLRAGLSRAPDDHEARLSLARIYLGVNSVPTAIDILADGLSLGYPGREYLETLAHLLIESGRQNELPELLRLAWTTLDDGGEETVLAAESEWLTRRLIEALLVNQRPREAQAFARDELSPGHALRRKTEIVALRSDGELDAARRLAERWTADDADAEEPLLQLMDICSAQRDFEGLDEAINRLKSRRPTSPEPWIEGVCRQFAAGRENEAARALDELVWRHGSRGEVYDQAARIFADIGYEAGLRRLRAEANQRGLPDRTMLWGMVVCAEKNRDWPRVLTGLEEIESADQSTPDAEKERIATLRLLALNCLEGGTGQAVALVESIAGRTLKLASYLQIIDSLLVVGHLDTAGKVLALAEGPYPGIEEIKARHIRLAEARARIPAPAPAMKDAQAVHLETPATFEAAFVRLLETNGERDALALIDLARRESPSWFQNESGRMDRLELPLRARGDDLLRLQVLLRAMLGRATTPTTGLLALAQEIHSAHPQNARLILDEILRFHPEDKETRQTLLTLFPPPALVESGSAAQAAR